MIKNSKLIILILLTVSFFSIIGLVHPGFPKTDDGNWMVIRFSAFFEVLRNGEFPVRFLMRLNNGYGYPVSDFLYPLFMYIGLPIHVFGVNFVNTIKLILALSLISSCLFSYLWLKSKFNNISSLTGSIFYTLFPYHLYDVYVRGSVGEVISFAVLPFVLWQIERKSFLITSIGVSLLILSHNTLALLFLPVTILYGIFIKKNLKFVIWSHLLGFGISAFFWIPAIYDRQFTVFDKVSVSDFSNYFINQNNWTLFGFVFIVFFISSVFFVAKEKNKKYVLYLISILFLVLFTTSSSFLFWKNFPFTNLIQFPFRIMSLILILSTFFITFRINFLKVKKQILVSIIFILFIFISSYPYILPKDYQYYPDTFYSTNQDTTTVKNEYMPIWIKNIPTEMYKEKVVNINGNEKINLIESSPVNTSFNTYLNQDRQIRVNTVYFPGWTAYVNGKESAIEYQKDGLINFDLKKGTNNVTILFKETQTRIIADLISIISLISLVVIFYLERKKRIVL